MLVGKLLAGSGMQFGERSGALLMMNRATRVRSTILASGLGEAVLESRKR